jgi:hypothetical protein
MSEENTFYTENNDVDNLEYNEIPVANLEDGESIIPESLLDKYEEAVRELSEDLDLSGIKISKPTEMPEADENNVIGSSGTQKTGGIKRSAITPNEDGVISSGRADKLNQQKPSKKKKVAKKETIAIFSSKNVTWQGVGKVYRGYNIVEKEAGEKWLTRGHIRLATPDEIKQEFDK